MCKEHPFCIKQGFARENIWNESFTQIYSLCHILQHVKHHVTLVYDLIQMSFIMFIIYSIAIGLLTRTNRFSFNLTEWTSFVKHVAFNSNRLVKPSHLQMTLTNPLIIILLAKN